MNRLVRQLEISLNQLEYPGQIRATGDQTTSGGGAVYSPARSPLNLSLLPTNTTGLTSGDVWVDISGSTVFTGTAEVIDGVLTNITTTTGSLSVGNGVTGTGFPLGTRIDAVGASPGDFVLNNTFTAALGSITGFSSGILRVYP